MRRLLGHGLTMKAGAAVCFSAEKANEASVAENGFNGLLALTGKPLPSVYSADMSEFVFAAGVKLMESMRPDLIYLSSSEERRVGKEGVSTVKFRWQASHKKNK